MMNFNYKYTDTELKELLKSLTVVIDTREKENKHITDYFDKKKIPYIKKALGSGDYTFMLPQNNELGIIRDVWFNKDMIFERKASLEELSTNFTKYRTRFEEEMATAKALYKYLIIENASYADIIKGKYKTDYAVKSYLGTLHTFNHRYELQVAFMPDKQHTPIYLYGTMQYYLREILK